MKLLLLALATLVAISPAAQAAPIQKPFTVNCTGANGFLHLDSTPEKTAYEFHINSLHLKGETQSHADNGTEWEQVSASYIEPTYQKAKWLSVMLSKGGFAYSPELKICRPTRNEKECYGYKTIPANYHKKHTEFHDLMIDVTTPGTAAFMSFSFLGQEAIKDLGAGTQCTVEGLEE